MKKKILFLFLLGMFSKVFSAEYTLEELDALYNDKVITQEEYSILKKEILGSNELESGYYNLKINGKQVTNIYSVATKGERAYLNLEEFLTLLNLNNYEKKDSVYKIYLGNSLEEVVIDTKKNRVSKNGKNISLKENWYSMEKGNLYLEKDVFQELFLSYCTVDNSTLQVSMYVNFATPEEISSILDVTADKLKNVDVQPDIVYRGKRSLFDLGYTRVQLGQSFVKNEHEKKYKSNWDGSLEYQGGLLYGEFFAGYDLKEKELRDLKLEYENIWNDHTFVINNRGNGSKREWGLAFYKDKGFTTDGSKITIKESVPIGSRAELIYMGTPIAIEDEVNGSVEFTNDMIVGDRTYQLKIYTPDGKITLKEIKTVEDYNRQNRHEIKYDFSIDENKDKKRYATKGNVFYGITDNFTLGGGYTRDIVDTENGYKYFDSNSLEVIYGEVYNGYSYTLRTSGEKTWNSFDEYSKKLDDRYKYEVMGDLRVGKYKYKLSQENYGKYYDEKRRNNFEFQYDVFDNTRLTYDIEDMKRYDKTKERSEKLGFSHDFTFKKVLLGSSAKFDLKDSNKNEYSLNAYYNGWQSMTARLENKWENSGKDYETTLNFYNNNFRGLFDVSVELGYSNIRKESVTFKVSLDIDNWLTFDSNISKNGSKEFRVGIDRVIDLKNPKVRIDSMDVSRVNVITFIDNNNNNILDSDEITIDGVEVTIGNQKLVTNKKGRGTFYNISNGLLHDLKPKIKKPSFALGDNKIKVLSNVSSTVDAYIPVKPMINLHGVIELDKILKLNEQEKEDFYSEILIEIKDEKGKTIELVSPDNTGTFDVSGLFPDSYNIEVSYVGTKYNIESLAKEMKLDYKYNEFVLGFEHKITFNVTNQSIKLTEHI